MSIAGNANHRILDLSIAQLPGQWILTRPLAACKRLTHDNDVLLAWLKRSAQQQGNLHGLKEPRTHPVRIDCNGFAIHYAVLTRYGVSQGRKQNEGNRANAGQGGQASLHLIQIVLCCGRFVTVLAKLGINRGQSLVPKARLREKRVLAGANQQRGNDQQDTTAGHLSANQNLPRACFVLTLPGYLKRRRESEQ